MVIPLTYPVTALTSRVYRSSIPESTEMLLAFTNKVNADDTLGQFIFLTRTRHDVSPSLTILGCTLWSALNPDDLDILSSSLTDFRRIASFNPDNFDAMHRADLEWPNATVSSLAKTEPDRRVVIFTHHAPTIEGTGDAKFLGQPCWGNGNVALWAFGHAHWSCDFVRKGVGVYSNERGYGDGGESYDVSRVVEL